MKREEIKVGVGASKQCNRKQDMSVLRGHVYEKCSASVQNSETSGQKEHDKNEVMNENVR